MYLCEKYLFAMDQALQSLTRLTFGLDKINLNVGNVLIPVCTAVF